MTNNPNTTNPTPINRPQAPAEIDWTAVYARVEFIADTLRIPYSEVEKTQQSEADLIDFAHRNKQSLDWIIEGDVRSMIKLLAGKPLA